MQAVCFILFYLVLKTWAWGPVLQFLEERRQRIKNEFDKIASMEKAAAASQANLDERLAKIEDEARVLVQEAVAEGRRAAEDIAERARADGKEIRAHAQQMAEIEFAKAMQQVKEDVSRMVIQASERLLQEKMDDEHHRRLVSRFVDDLGKN
jgi:F-type H+-transporting ATPase subunit b